MKIKAGIIVDDYKVAKFSSTLAERGYTFKISPLTRDTSLFSFEAETFEVKGIYAVCAELEKEFKQLKDKK